MTEEVNQAKDNQPKYHAYTVTEPQRRGQKGYWHRIGAVFTHEDGEGLTLMLDSLPFNGRIVMRAPKPELEKVEG